MTETFRAIRDLKWLLVSVCALAVGTLAAHAQNPTPSQTPAAQRPAPAALPSPSPTPTPINWSEDPMLKRFVFRGIGPASMGGRIDDIAGVDSNPYIYYVGFATGGVWKTTNNGTTFQPIFDTYSRGSIGDIAIAPSNPDIVWVGTGEANNRQSSSFGDGIYKSTDAGKTFARMGLEDSQSIARIVIDPKDPNIVYVAVLGHLFGPNKERGVYKTTDGGKTWNNVKFIDEDTGFTDLVIDPSDSKTLYAASYQRRRTSFGFNGGGPGSGIWKTTDAGKTWTKLQGNGLPEGLLAGSASMFRDRIRMWFMRRWKSAPAPAPVVTNQPQSAVDSREPLRRRPLRRVHHRQPQRIRLLRQRQEVRSLAFRRQGKNLARG